MKDVTPKFIVMEGLDGSGKTTQLGRLEAYLGSRGRRVFVTREPTSSVTGGLLRDALSGESRRSDCEMAALFVLDRIYHNQNPICGINKMLADGYDVICDRYYYSSMAYQGSMTDFEWVRRMNIDCPEIRRPDLCIFLDLDPRVCLERISANRTTTEIYETEDTLTAVRQSYYRVFDAVEDRIAVIDTAADIDSVADAVRSAVNSIYGF